MTKVTNEDLLAEVIKSQETGNITETLGKMMVYIAQRYAERYMFIGYDSSVKEDATQFAILQMVKQYSSFKPEKSNDAMTFLCQIAGCSFTNVMGKERNQKQTIKDATNSGEVI